MSTHLAALPADWLFNKCRQTNILCPPPSSLHGSPLLDAGLVTLNTALSTHPTLVCLDLGDCMLGDEALGLICGMLPPDGAKSGETVTTAPGLSARRPPADALMALLGHHTKHLSHLQHLTLQPERCCLC